MKPKASVIITTKNSAKTLRACLESIKKQTYQNIETVLVDNHSTDDTAKIAREFTDKVYIKGPERSAQRNYAVTKASGEYVFIIDSDMELSEKVVEECVTAIDRSGVTGVIVPEESFGEGFWAQCKKLERSFYVGVDYMEAARFFRRKTYLDLGGYDLTMTSGEDWDLSQRFAALGKLARIKSYIYHNEGRISLVRTIKKKYYYAQKISSYLDKQQGKGNVKQQAGVLNRYGLFLSKPGKLFKNPLLGLGMLYMKTAEFAAGGLGLLLNRPKS